jgi:nucleotide-binding universal stress UspA family protein
MGMTSILVAMDFSPPGKRALDEAIAVARALAARVEVLHVHKFVSSPLPPTMEVAQLSPTAKAVAEAEAALADQVARVRAAGLPCDGESRFGQPGEQIAKRALEIAARYIVIGSHGHGPIRQALLGSTAESVLRQAPCPVLIVPAPRTQDT